VPQPSLEEVLEGALRRQTQGFGQNAQFWYPQNGGIDALPKAFLPHVKNINLNQEVVAVCPEKRSITLVNGGSRRYNRLISSLPLNKIVDMMDSVPGRIKEAAHGLKYNTIYSVNIGVNRAGISDAHWIYFPEKEFIFHRISFPMNFSPAMAPENTSSVTAEISTPTDEEDMDERWLIQKVINDLTQAHVLKEDDEILASEMIKLKPAYIIYDHSHSRNVSIIQQFLRERNIYPCGRFGMWEYYNMDHAILSGKAAAESCAPRNKSETIDTKGD